MLKKHAATILASVKMGQQINQWVDTNATYLHYLNRHVERSCKVPIGKDAQARSKKIQARIEKHDRDLPDEPLIRPKLELLLEPIQQPELPPFAGLLGSLRNWRMSYSPVGYKYRRCRLVTCCASDAMDDTKKIKAPYQIAFTI